MHSAWVHQHANILLSSVMYASSENQYSDYGTRDTPLRYRRMGLKQPSIVHELPSNTPTPLTKAKPLFYYRNPAP